MEGVGRADGTAYGNEYVYDENGNVVKEIVHSWDGTVTDWTSGWKARLKGRAFLRADGCFLNGKIIASGSGIGYNGMDSTLCEVTKG